MIARSGRTLISIYCLLTVATASTASFDTTSTGPYILPFILYWSDTHFEQGVLPITRPLRDALDFWVLIDQYFKTKYPNFNTGSLRYFIDGKEVLTMPYESAQIINLGCGYINNET